MLLNPFVVFAVLNLVFAIWHIPRYYETSLYNTTAQAIQHIAFFATATLAWWPIFGTLDEFSQLVPGMKWGMNALEDQQLAGLLIWVGGGLIHFLVLTVVFFRWFGRNDDDYWEVDLDSDAVANYNINT